MTRNAAAASQANKHRLTVRRPDANCSNGSRSCLATDPMVLVPVVLAVTAPFCLPSNEYSVALLTALDLALADLMVAMTKPPRCHLQRNRFERDESFDAFFPPSALKLHDRP